MNKYMRKGEIAADTINVDQKVGSRLLNVVNKLQVVLNQHYVQVDIK